MSWFSNAFSLPLPSSPRQPWGTHCQEHLDKEDENEEAEEGDLGGSPNLASMANTAGKGVKEDLSELTKSLTRQLWGVASFLVSPPSKCCGISRADSPRAVGLHSGDLRSSMIFSGEEEERNVFRGENDIELASSTARDTILWAGYIGDSSPTSPPNSVEGRGPDQRLAGIRNDLEELRGSVATGLSRITSVILEVALDEFGDDVSALKTSPERTASGHQGSPLGHGNNSKHFNSWLKPVLGGEKETARNWGGEARLACGDVEADAQAQDFESYVKASCSSISDGDLDGLPKLSSSLLPFGHDVVAQLSLETNQREWATGLTDEVVTFARNIAMHPETWLDFPLTDNKDGDEFRMTEAQQKHADAVEHVAPGLRAVHLQMCPNLISDGRFWKIYFVLLHSRLSKLDADLLSTPQIISTRALLIQEQHKGETNTGDGSSNQCQQDGIASSNSNHFDGRGELSHPTLQSEPSQSMEPAVAGGSMLDMAVYSEGAPLATTESEEPGRVNTMKYSSFRREDNETQVDEWLDNADEDNADGAATSARIAQQGTTNAGITRNVDEEVSFSALEDEDSGKEGPQTWPERMDNLEGLRALTGQDATVLCLGEGDREIPQEFYSSAQVLTQDLSGESVHGYKSDRGEFNDWLTVNQEDIASDDSCP